MKNINKNIHVGECKSMKTPVFKDIEILSAFKCRDTKGSVYIKVAQNKGICVEQGTGSIAVGEVSGFSENFDVIPATTEIKITF